MQIELTQEQSLSAQQLQCLKILQMSRLDILQHINALAEENPTVEVDSPGMEDTFSDVAQEVWDCSHWLEEQSNAYSYADTHIEKNVFIALEQFGTDGGLAETLALFLQRQIDTLAVSRRTKDILSLLADCLDENGYMCFSDQELAQSFHAPEAEICADMELLRSLEPAGIGARSLSECLLLQLERLRDDTIATPIVREHLDDLGKCHYKVIAGALGVSSADVRRALVKIRELDPRPGRQFSPMERTEAILPDLCVIEENGEYVCDESRFSQPVFHINPYYLNLYHTTDDPEVRKYLNKKLEQASSLLHAMGQRKSTLLRCCAFLTAHQQAFFRDGPAALQPLRMTDAAQELGLHVSTVSRALSNKYLQCSQGVFPLRYFFSASASASEGSASRNAVQTLLRHLIATEDPQNPLSDEELRIKLTAQGCPISRRTVAKYREELQIPSYLHRAQTSETTST